MIKKIIVYTYIAVVILAVWYQIVTLGFKH